MPNSEHKHLIEQELSSGERLLWSGVPQKAPLPKLALFYLIFISIWLCGVLAFLMVGLLTNVVPNNGTIRLIFALVPGFMLLVGLLFFWVALRAVRRPSKQVYGLTTRRGLIIENHGKGPVRSLSKDELANLTRKGGTTMGTLQFQGPRLSQFDLTLSNLAGVAFHNISDPKRVENIIFQKIIGDRQ